MKTIRCIFTSLLILVTLSTVGQTLSKGYVTYEVTSKDEAFAMMEGTTMTSYFDDKQTALTMNMMGGLMIIKVIGSYDDPLNQKYLVEVMGSKYEVIDVKETNKLGNNLVKLEDIDAISYRKKDTKVIFGYTCYRADIRYKNGDTGVFYLTKKIKPLFMKTENSVQLDGFPLEMQMVSNGLAFTLTARNVSKSLPKDSFTVPSNFEKVSFEQMDQKMGGKM